MGLRQIFYTKLWNNVDATDNAFYMRVGANLYMLHLSPGYYDPAAYLVKHLNELVRATGGSRVGIQFAYSQHQHKLKLALQKDRSLIFPTRSALCTLLGVCKKGGADSLAEFVMYDTDEGYVELVQQPRDLPTKHPDIYIRENPDDVKSGVTVTADQQDLVKTLSNRGKQLVRIFAWRAAAKPADDDDDDDMLSESKVPPKPGKELSIVLQSELHLDAIPRLYVYSSLIQYVHVGNGLAPLLGIVRVTGHHGEQVQENFDQPLFVPLYTNVIDQITLKICNERGAIVDFGGEVVVVLQIRRIRAL